jgi:SAM-dependent methyltransferase
MTSGPSERHRLRKTFEQVPELYDRARPSYPAQLFDDLQAFANLRAGDRVLELGPGTGKATVALAERGLKVVGVELGESLAAVARRKLAAYPDVEILNLPFERWETDGRFHAIVAFTAFHWIDPDVRYEKTARLLRAGGSLAVVETNHVLPEDGDRFWEDVQADYDAVFPSPDNRPPPRPDEVPDLSEEIAASGYFRKPTVRRYLWEAPYTGDEYIAVLDTYSGHRTLPPERRDELYRRIRGRIGERTVTKTYLFTLNLASRP